MATNEGYVYFALDGDDFDPDDVTAFLGIEPTSISRKGSRVPGKVPKRNSWKLGSAKVVNEYIDVYEMSAELLKRLKPIKERLLEAKRHFNASPRFEIVLWFSMNEEHSTPAIGLEVEMVQFLGEIGALIDIDTYKH